MPTGRQGFCRYLPDSARPAMPFGRIIQAGTQIRDFFLPLVQSTELSSALPRSARLCHAKAELSSVSEALHD